jgi:phosphate starvation-inducible protein PhoH
MQDSPLEVMIGRLLENSQNWEFVILNEAQNLVIL